MSRLSKFFVILVAGSVGSVALFIDCAYAGLPWETLVYSFAGLSIISAFIASFPVQRYVLGGWVIAVLGLLVALVASSRPPEVISFVVNLIGGIVYGVVGARIPK